MLIKLRLRGDEGSASVAPGVVASRTMALRGRAWFHWFQAGCARLAARIRGARLPESGWRRGAVLVLGGVGAVAATLVLALTYHVRFDQDDLPDFEAFSRFELPSIGRIYDANGHPLMEMASQYRQLTPYEGIPPIVRGALVAAEDKNFFTHSGIDYTAFARVVWKLRVRTLLGRLTKLGWRNSANSAAIFPQGGSTITQQVVRGYFLQKMTAEENSDQLRHRQLPARALSAVIGARMVNMMFRKLEEIRLSLWIERAMEARFGSKRRAKEEILARYASLVYMGHGQYGFARAAEYYFGRPMSTFTIEDADKAALLAGTTKSARTYAPDSSQTERVRYRRDQILGLMEARALLTPDRARRARQKPIVTVVQAKPKSMVVSAVVGSVLDELKLLRADLDENDLQQGRVQVYTTVDTRIQEISNEALEHGLLQYEKRHPAASGLIQGSVIVLRNSDGAILAETGGRQFYKGRRSAYSDFNRVTQSLRQPGSAMKPLVYLAAFRSGRFDLDTMVPDEPISVPNGEGQEPKRISNYDGQFKGMIPLRLALAESRNTVAIWIAGQIGMNSILDTSQKLGIRTPLRSYVTTALGASEVNLRELSNAYRAIASGVVSQPRMIRKIVLDSGEEMPEPGRGPHSAGIDGRALSLIQEGLRSAVRMPTGTAHALDSYGLPFAVMGKTGTTNEFRDALFVGSTYGVDGITVAVRIGFDDNRSMGRAETGGRVALPVAQEILLGVYREKLAGPAPRFPGEMEQRISDYLSTGEPEADQVATAPAQPLSELNPQAP
ncbi:transglycosylase domain-containing protein [Paludibaculum fermentans]|uniref:peptidoglycan glycosyltransferase n=1 Tax=Paludibaculum fermentans TaxID=1473598 RepID=A0A7S7SNI6_PALFE|nr:transglycosylase domain-containing protein [Paludibaculum fermentans]QOY90160.1 transglycosylase domain-containing protein [Paludibaculum fermentans]